MARVLDENEKARVYSIAKEIDDALSAIKSEVLSGCGYTGYLADKLKMIMVDVSCLDQIFNSEV